MTYVFPPKARRGGQVTARRLNAVEEGSRGNQVVSGPGVLIGRGVAGTSIDARPDDRPWVRITAASGTGAYGWQRIRGSPGGGWADGIGSGTTLVSPLYEANGVTNLPIGTRVQMAREPGSGEWRTQLGMCS